MLQQSHACNMQHVEDTINYPQLMDYFRSAMIKATKQWKLKLQPKDVVVTGQIKKRKSFLCSLLSSGTIYAGVLEMAQRVIEGGFVTCV